ncbi:hypothetical protein ACWKSP_19235 [Micromonosporaceae bacterium Da 78-11]
MILMLKLLLAPALVVGSSLAGRRWGAGVTGMLVALPIVAGPILLVTCLEHGALFGARAASSALFGLVTLALFAVVFAWCARLTGWPGALAIAWSATLLVDLGLARLSVPPLWGLLVVLVAAYAAARTLPHDDRPNTEPGDQPKNEPGDEPGGGAVAGPVSWPWWDLPGRALATAVLVVAVTTAAGAAGPALTGVLAPFPIATSVVAAFVLAQRGPAATAETLRGVPRGLLGFAVFCYLVAVLVTPLGVAAAFTLAVAGALGAQFAFRSLTNQTGQTGQTGRSSSATALLDRWRSSTRF